MPDVRKAWIAGFGGSLLLAALSVPAILPGLGIPAWHHTISLGVSVVLFVSFAFLGRTDMRRHLALGVGLWTLLALVSGFVILYSKPWLKSTELKDWAKFWHVAWSWLSLWYGIGHMVWNLHGMRRMWAHWNSTIRGRILSSGLFGLILAAIPLSWNRWGATVLQEPQFIPLTLWTWLAMLTLPYGIWLTWTRLRPGHAPAWMQRPAAQRFVDLWLTPMMLLANLSGIPLVYLATKEGSLKYVAKYWHVWPSIAMAVLVFAHTVQFWPGLVSHWQRRRSA